MNRNLNKSLDIAQACHQDQVGLVDQQDLPCRRNQGYRLVRLYQVALELYRHLYHLAQDNQVGRHYHWHHQVQENLARLLALLVLMDLFFLEDLFVLVVRAGLVRQIPEVRLAHCPLGSMKVVDRSVLLGYLKTENIKKHIIR